jgi:ABC-type cobalamin transport system permease subunit
VVLEIAFWLLGSLEDRSFQHVMLAFPFIIAGAIMLFSQRHAFRALSLGEETAQSLGVDVGRLRLFVISGGRARRWRRGCRHRHHRFHRAGCAASDAAADRA